MVEVDGGTVEMIPYSLFASAHVFIKISSLSQFHRAKRSEIFESPSREAQRNFLDYFREPRCRGPRARMRSRAAGQDAEQARGPECGAEEEEL